MKDGNVILKECLRTKCGHIYLEEETVWTEPGIVKAGDVSYHGFSNGCCPRCGEQGYFTLNALGQRRKGREGFAKPEVAVANISPSPRMGLKRRRRVLAAKRRALGPVYRPPKCGHCGKPCEHPCTDYTESLTCTNRR